MVARTGHRGADQDVVSFMQAPRAEPARVRSPARESAGASPYLRIVLRELDHSGSGSPIFWGVFWAAFPNLSRADLERVALAAGNRGRAQFRAITACQSG